eukprot:scaffold856_cov326-Pavlova_lutheri.AAC.9
MDVKRNPWEGGIGREAQRTGRDKNDSSSTGVEGDPPGGQHRMVSHWVVEGRGGTGGRDLPLQRL